MSEPLSNQAELDELGHSMRRFYIDAFQQRVVGGWPAGLRVLDLGGNRVLKRGGFDVERFGQRVVYANWSVEKKPHVRADAAGLPFRDGAFDALICAELLEHVYDPLRVVREAARVLRPGGRLLITVPFLVHIHGDPEDYGRYTDSFWRRALAEAGFEAISIEKQGLFWSVLFDSLRIKTMDWRRSGSGWRPWVSWVESMIRWGRRRAWAMECGGRGIDAGKGAAAPLLSEQFTTGYGIAAVRSGGER